MNIIVEYENSEQYVRRQVLLLSQSTKVEHRKKQVFLHWWSILDSEKGDEISL